jgi:HK97 family phage prohead protease
MQKTFFASLKKVEAGADDTLTVEGVASTETRDSTGEIITAAAIRKALPAYREFPAIREMHGLSAAGSAIDIDVDDDGVTKIVASITDPTAIKKVKSGTYRGFSIGGKVLKRDAKDAKTITEILLTEVSLVDRPANGEAKISLWKGAALPTLDSVFESLSAEDKAIALIKATHRIVRGKAA